MINSSYLTKSEILEFQQLMKNIMRLELSYSESEDQATRLVMLFELMRSSSGVPLSYKDTVDKYLGRVKNE